MPYTTVRIQVEAHDAESSWRSSVKSDPVDYTITIPGDVDVVNWNLIIRRLADGAIASFKAALAEEFLEEEQGQHLTLSCGCELFRLYGEVMPTDSYECHQHGKRIVHEVRPMTRKELDEARVAQLQIPLEE